MGEIGERGTGAMIGERVLAVVLLWWALAVGTGGLWMPSSSKMDATNELLQWYRVCC